LAVEEWEEDEVDLEEEPELGEEEPEEWDPFSNATTTKKKCSREELA